MNDLTQTSLLAIPHVACALNGMQSCVYNLYSTSTGRCQAGHALALLNIKGIKGSLHTPSFSTDAVGQNYKRELPGLYSAQINDIMLDSGIQVHMSAQLIQGLPSLGGSMCMKASLWALLHQLQAPRRGQPEQATALPRVSGRHDNCNCFLQHRLHGTGPHYACDIFSIEGMGLHQVLQSAVQHQQLPVKSAQLRGWVVLQTMQDVPRESLQLQCKAFNRSLHI